MPRTQRIVLTFALAFGVLLALGALVAWSVTMVEIDRVRRLLPTAAAPLGYLSAASCCRYSRAALPALTLELQRVVREAVIGNVRFAYVTHAWADFVSALPDLETRRNESAYLTALDDLRTRTRAVRAAASGTGSSRDSALENVHLDTHLAELDYLLNLSAVDAYFMQTGLARWHAAWVDDPLATAAATLDVLPVHVAEPDFGPRVLAWLAALQLKADRWFALAERAVQSGKVHANATIVAQFDVGTRRENRTVNYGYIYAFRANYTAFCNAVFVGGSDAGDACLLYATGIEARLAAFETWWLETYLLAAAAARPNSAPGLRTVPDGAAIYAILQQYHLATAATTDDLYEDGEARVNATLDAYAELAPLVLANETATLAELLEALSDPDDERFYLCTNITAEAADAVRSELARAALLLPAHVGILPRTLVAVAAVPSAGASTFDVGAFDTRHGFWLTAGHYTVAPLGRCRTNETGYYAYERAGLASAVARDALPGSALHLPLLREMECSLLDVLPPPSPLVSAWALYAQEAALRRGTYDTPLAQLGYYQSRALRENRLRLDACFHAADASANCTTAEARALVLALGWPATVADFEVVRSLAMPAQGSAAVLGNATLHVERARLFGNTTSTPTLSLSIIYIYIHTSACTYSYYLYREGMFHNLFLRYAGASTVPSSNFSRLVDGLAPFVDPAQLYRSGGAMVGLGRDAQCLA